MGKINSNRIYCLLLFALSSTTWANDQVQFATDPWPPYFLETNKDEVSNGLGIDLVDLIFKDIKGFEPNFPKIPWKRALLEVASGQKDAIALLLKTTEREKTMIFSDPIIKTEGVLLFNKLRFPNGFKWQTTKDLEQFVLGVVRGYSYGSLLDNYISNNPEKVYEVTTSKQLFSMLEKQRIDLISESLPVATGIASEQGWLNNLGIADKPVNTDVLYIALSKKSAYTHLIDDINQAIDKYTKSGEIDQIMGINGKSLR